MPETRTFDPAEGDDLAKLVRDAIGGDVRPNEPGATPKKPSRTTRTRTTGPHRSSTYLTSTSDPYPPSPTERCGAGEPCASPPI